jgi:hypothetical protein
MLMNRMRLGLIVVLGVVALAVPAGAFAKPGEHGGKGKAKGHRPHNVAYVFKGIYSGEASIEVKRGNSRVRKGGFIGQTVAFNLEATRIVVRDVNADGERNLDDVQVGDWVLVKARLPRTDPGEQPFDATKLIDKTSFHG